MKNQEKQEIKIEQRKQALSIPSTARDDSTDILRGQERSLEYKFGSCRQRSGLAMGGKSCMWMQRDPIVSLRDVIVCKRNSQKREMAKRRSNAVVGNLTSEGGGQSGAGWKKEPKSFVQD